MKLSQRVSNICDDKMLVMSRILVHFQSCNCHMKYRNLCICIFYRNLLYSFKRDGFALSGGFSCLFKNIV